MVIKEYMTKKYYTIVFPGEHGQHVQETWSTDQILKLYYTYWSKKMIESGNSHLVSEERCIEDWITIHWGQETDEFGNKIKKRKIRKDSFIKSSLGYSRIGLDNV